MVIAVCISIVLPGCGTIASGEAEGTVEAVLNESSDVSETDIATENAEPEPHVHAYVYTANSDGTHVTDCTNCNHSCEYES